MEGKRGDRRESDGMVELSIVPDDPMDTPINGEPFGKYMLIGELAVGGMAEVYLGVQQGLQGYLKIVTIKRMLPHLSASPEFVSMFVDEARLGARLEHPNIVRTYEFGEHEGKYFTVMEYLPGEEVSKLLNRAAGSKQPLPLNVGVHIAMQVCSGLHFAHELTDSDGNPLGLVHRDVNPSNIIITYGGEVKLIDFGVAKSKTNTSQTLSGTIKGKLQYMSPEQVLGNGTDRRSDVFSTGVVLWELLTTRPLFVRDNEAATLYAIINDPIPSPRQFRPDIPRELDAMVAKALARNPEDRFESCETMLFALESFLGTQPRVDAREISKLMESVFGATRANAKRSIAQTRSLAQNVSLVMKLRTDVRTDLVGQVEAVREQQATEQRSSTGKLVFAFIAIALLMGAGGLGFFMLREDSPASAAKAPAVAKIELASTPSGAAIFIGSEPTGLRTPAVITDLRPGTIAIRVELPGHHGEEETISLAAGEVVQRTLVLDPMRGRLVLAKLPANAEIWVDGKEQLVGEVINTLAGPHVVRIDVGGKTIVTQTVPMTAGDQVWELETDKLVRR
jgi:serine/threonine protein kinase